MANLNKKQVNILYNLIQVRLQFRCRLLNNSSHLLLILLLIKSAAILAIFFLFSLIYETSDMMQELHT